MFVVTRFKSILLLVSAMLLLTACPEKSCKDGVPALLVDYTGLSGCQWILILQSGERLEPVNLHELDFTPVDSMLVHITFIETPAMMSICMVGKMVEITCISKIDVKPDKRAFSFHAENTKKDESGPSAGVIAYPGLISYELPDGYTLRIFMTGDENSHIVTTEDHLLLLMGNEGFYEYASYDDEGNPVSTGIVARNEEDRTKQTQNFLNKINK